MTSSLAPTMFSYLPVSIIFKLEFYFVAKFGYIVKFDAPYNITVTRITLHAANSNECFYLILNNSKVSFEQCLGFIKNGELHIVCLS